MKRDYRNQKADERYAFLKDHPEKIPFFFTYGGREYAGFSANELSAPSREIVAGEGKESCRFTFAPLGVLQVSLLLTHYFSHGVTEWTAFFENVGAENSEMLENPETVWDFEGKYPILRGIGGDYVNQYSPYSVALTHQCVTFSSDSGRATHINFPYFNLEHGEGGTMLAIGWGGTWHAEFSSDGDKTRCRVGGVNGLCTYLKPGERIRTPLFVTAPYGVRNEHYATNFWRSWFVQHNLPRADAAGTPLAPFSTCCLASDTGLTNSDGSVSERSTTWRPTLEKMIEEDVKVDFRWMDAGWYTAPDLGSAVPFQKGHDWWDTVGTWEFDPEKWPAGSFLESTEFARQNGMKTLLWFEPERVAFPDDLAKNFGYDPRWAIRLEGERAISNNIGDPACLAYTTGRICRTLRENKVEMYREDNNCNPGKLWKHLDASEGAGRCGITECKFIDGHYKMWDDIIACTKSYGGCAFVDSCASGGGRNDLESLRRGVPLLRSDSDRTTTALRLSMTTAFNKWVPFCGANTKEKKQELSLTGVSDPYVWRASYLPSLNVDTQLVQDPAQDFGALRFGLKEWARVAPYLLKEFYVLTPWHKEKDVTDFTAYCFFDPEREEGVLLAFRQEKCEREALKLHLPFADGGKFTLTDEDSGDVTETTGDLTLSFGAPRTARLLWIKTK